LFSYVVISQLMKQFRSKRAGLLVIAAAVLAFHSCKEQGKAGSTAPMQDILAANMDTNVRPGDDFFSFANGLWISNNPIPDDETSWGIANKVNDELYERKRNINQDAVNAASPNTVQRQLASFWTAAMDTAKIEQDGIRALEAELKAIAAAKNSAELMDRTAVLHTIGVNVFFDEGVGQDEKNSEMMAYQMSQGGLGMPNRDYYFNTDARTAKIREAYPRYISRIMQLAGYDSVSAAQKAAAILSVETRLAKASRKLEDLRDPYLNYHKMDVSTLTGVAPGIAWSSVFSRIGLPKTDTIIVGQPEFYKALSELIRREPLQNLKDYMSFHLVSNYAPYLGHDFVIARFDFYNRTIRGAKEMRPRWKRVLDAEEELIGELLGQLFVKEYFNTQAKKRYEDITEGVREAYKKRIQQLSWMSDSTKAKALKKLAAMKKKVGYPDKWKDFSGLQLDKSSYAGNVMRARQWWNKYGINKLGKPVDREEWEMTPQTYNAYYHPSNNEIVLPAGIFTVPGMRDEQLDDALVYGYAAASTIGHEITHGFDDQGRQYDEHGNLNNWWSKEDEAQFNRRAAVLVQQFSNMVVIDTLHINGKATLGENLADLGGLLIGLDAFKASDAGKSDARIGGYTPMQRFFLGYALGWLYQMRSEQLASQLLTDVHAPAKYRVNGPLPNVPGFSEAFGIKPGAKMYLEDSLKVVLW
jgi:putative endopeptidase